MASKVDICSNALLILGAQPINSLDEEDDRARLASNLYDGVKLAVIRAHPWNCCVTRAALSPLSSAPAFDYAYQFTLPPDCAKILQVGEYLTEVDYRIERGKILSNESVIYLKYISTDVSEGAFDSLLTEAIKYAMAAQMAYPITQTASMAELMESKYQMVLREAKTVDGQDDPPETLGDNALYASRFGGRRW